MLVLVGALALALAAHAADGERVSVNIPAGSAAVRLNEWAKQTRFQVLSSFDTTAPLRTQAVSGVYEPIEALRIMIAPTGLQYELVSERFVSLWLPQEQRGPTRPLAAPRPAPRKPLRSASQAELVGQDLQVVTVTGTHIRDTPRVGQPVVTLTQADFEAAGAATVAEPIRTLPQVFGGGPSEDTFNVGTEASTNSGRGIGVNLRGLDASSTLALVNGRRLAPGGSQGLFIDITSIPLIAVKQIDIMSDGASALYGADAVGGVVNFLMRENVSGNETQIRAGGLGGASLSDLQVGQLFGRQWQRGNALIALEYYERDALPASARTQATNDLRQLGGGDFRTLSSNPGTIQFGPMTWGIPSGQDGTNLTAADLIPGAQYRSDRLAGTDILPEQERWSGYGNLRHTLNESVELFGDALFTERRAISRIAAASTQIPVTDLNPFYVNPLGPLAPPVPILVNYNFIEDLGPLVGDARVSTINGVLGADSRLGASWNLTATAGYALEEQRQSIANNVDFAALRNAVDDPNPDTAFNPFGDGSHTNPATLARIRSDFSLRTHSSVSSWNVTVNGPLFPLPGGKVKLAVGGDLRRQSFEADVQAGPSAPPNHVESRREVGSVFGELYVPLFGEPNARAGLRKLDLSLAARLEDYSDFGQTTTPRVGLAWSPLAGFSLRSSWAESLRAPSLYALNEIHNVITYFPLSNPMGGGVPALILSGQNADLREERATSWTFGADFTPASLPDFSLALTYFEVTFRERIEALGFFDFDYLNDPRVAQLIVLNPTPEQRAAACRRGTFSAPVAVPCNSAPAGAILDLRLHNSAYMRTNGIDLLAKYELHTSSFGSFRFGLLGTYVLDYSEASLRTLPVESYVGTQNHPVELRLRGSTTWKRRGFSATGVFNYSDSYRDTLSVPNRRVSAWKTLDVNLAYAFGDDESGTRVSVNVENVFNELPPFLNNNAEFLGYDAENADITGRIVSFRVRRNW